MDVEILERPSFAHLRARLGPGDRLIAEAGSLASMSAGVSLAPRLNGGPLRAPLRKVLGGETLFVNEFTAAAGGEVVISQRWPGDVESVALDGGSLAMQPGAFLACEPGVTLGLKWAGVASLVAREGLFHVEARGSGRVWFGAFGGILERTIDEELIVDSGHLVAYEPGLRLSLGFPGGVLASFFGSEGLIARVRGRGRIWLQTRSLQGLAGWTNGHLA